MGFSLDRNTKAALALGCREFLHERIDDSFNQYKDHYWDYEEDLKELDKVLFSKHVFENRVRMLKVQLIGWVEESMMGESPSIKSLISRGYKSTYKFVTQSSALIYSEFAVNFHKSVGKNGLSISDYCLRNNIFCLSYLAEVLDKRHTMDETLAGAIEGYESLVERESDEGPMMYRRIFSMDLLDSDVVEEVKRYMKDLWLFKPHEKVLVSVYLSSFQTKRLVESNIMKEVLSDNIEFLHRMSSSNSITPITTHFRLALSSQGMDVDDFLECTEISRKDVQDWLIFFILVCRESERRYNEATVGQMVASSAVLKSLSEVYKRSSQPRIEIELPILEGEDAPLSENILKVMDSFSATNLEVSASRTDTRDEDLRRLNKEVQFLRTELEAKDQHKRELSALREFVYRNGKVNVSTKESLEDMINYVSKFRVVVTGGQPTWINKLSEVLPTVRFLGTSKKPNYPIDSAKRADILFVDTFQLGHSSSGKAIAEAEKHDTPIHILSDHVNIELSVGEFYKALYDIYK